MVIVSSCLVITDIPVYILWIFTFFRIWLIRIQITVLVHVPDNCFFIGQHLFVSRNERKVLCKANCDSVWSGKKNLLVHVLTFENKEDEHFFGKKSKKRVYTD